MSADAYVEIWVLAVETTRGAEGRPGRVGMFGRGHHRKHFRNYIACRCILVDCRTIAELLIYRFA